MDYFEGDLHRDIVTGDAASVEAYLKRGLSPNHAFRSTESSGASRLGRTLLEEAVRAGQKDVIRVLARYRCDPNLTYVVHVDNYAYTLKQYVKKDRLKLSCVYPCIVKRDVDMVREIVQAGLDVNIHDDRGCTALWHAVDLQDYEMVKAMVKGPGPCDVNVADITKLRPLHVAALHGNVRMASLLVRHGAQVDVVQLRGSTPLVLACKAACFQTSRLLILNGADPNHMGYNGHTPLSAALENCHERALPDLLIRAGAIVDCSTLLKCYKEKLPLLQNCPEMLQLLREVAGTPHLLKVQCVLAIRRALLACSLSCHFVHKVQQLPVPRIIQEFILLSHLVLQKFVKEITVWVGKRVFSVSDEELDLRAQVRDLKEQQSSISMMDEFARYMKLQRQIDKLVSQVKDSGNTRQKKMTMLSMGVRIGLHVMHVLLMIVLVLIYRSEPLLMLPEGWFFPIQRLIAMPSGVEGGIGIVSWILVCNSVVFRAKRMLDL